MTELTRRETLLGLSAGAGTVAGAGWLSRAGGAAQGERTLSKLGQSLLGGPPVEFAEGVVRPDGRYAAVGTWNGDAYGSFLVDLADPARPERAHFLPSPDRVMNMDVKFGPRNGLYYRTQQPIEDQEMAGVEIVDYGYADGSPGEPTVIGRAQAGSTHNLDLHPNEPLLYAVNHDQKRDTKGVEIWDVSDPAAPSKVAEVGRKWSLHDVTVDANRDLLHCAYGKGYVAMDASDPRSPSETGLFDYRDKRSYEEAGLGNEGFETGHYAKADPRRDLVVMGDEVSTGVPGGKHIFDIGWGEGSPSNPIPVGFTTSPNAKVQERLEGADRGHNIFDWTGHNFDVVPWGDATLLVSGDWHEGVVLYDITDPTDPTPLDRYGTDDRAARARKSRWGAAPMAWSAVYNPARDLVVVSDLVTGVYTFRIGGGAPEGTPTATPVRPDGDGTDGGTEPAGAPERAPTDDCTLWELWCLDLGFDLDVGNWF